MRSPVPPTSCCHFGKVFGVPMDTNRVVFTPWNVRATIATRKAFIQ